MSLPGAVDQLAEILVHRDNESSFFGRERQNLEVGHVRAQIADCLRVVTTFDEPTLRFKTYTDVDKKLHAAFTGSTRSSATSRPA